MTDGFDDANPVVKVISVFAVAMTVVALALCAVVVAVAVVHYAWDLGAWEWRHT